MRNISLFCSAPVLFSEIMYYSGLVKVEPLTDGVSVDWKHTNPYVVSSCQGCVWWFYKHRTQYPLQTNVHLQVSFIKTQSCPPCEPCTGSPISPFTHLNKDGCHICTSTVWRWRELQHWHTQDQHWLARDQHWANTDSKWTNTDTHQTNTITLWTNAESTLTQNGPTPTHTGSTLTRSGPTLTHTRPALNQDWRTLDQHWLAQDQHWANTDSKPNIY